MFSVSNFLHVADPPTITQHPEELIAVPGKSVTFTVQATGTEPFNCNGMPTTIHWCSKHLHVKQQSAVADLGGVRGVQMHPPLAASNVFLRK